MEEKYLDVFTIKTEVKRHEKSISGRAILGLVLLFAAIWVGCTYGSLSDFLWSGLLFIPMIGLFVYIYWSQRRRDRAIENRDFHLVEDTCVKKKFVQGNVDRDDQYVLFFGKYGKYVELQGSQYARTAVGDVCYLLRLGGSKKVYWTFKKYEWQGLIGFEKRGDAYYPRNDE